MPLFSWIVFGLITGFAASKLVNGRGLGVLTDVVLGVLGAVIGGSLFNRLGMVGVVGFNLYGLLVAIVGAALVLVVYHAIVQR